MITLEKKQKVDYQKKKLSLLLQDGITWIACGNWNYFPSVVNQIGDNRNFEEGKRELNGMFICVLETQYALRGRV